jgi:hypothetical protein
MSSKVPRQTSGSQPKGGTSDSAQDRSPKAGDLGGGGSGGAADSCDLVIDADLEGVRAAGLQGLAPGTILTVRLERQDGYRSAICVRPDGEVVGALSAFRSISALIGCLEQDVEYSVEVTHVGPGSCHVRGGRASP